MRICELGLRELELSTGHGDHELDASRLKMVTARCYLACFIAHVLSLQNFRVVDIVGVLHLSSIVEDTDDR